MDSTANARFTLGRQSSLAPEPITDGGVGSDDSARENDDDVADEYGIDPRVRLMYLANERDLEGLIELLDSGVDVNFRDIDNRTALHVAACQGFTDVAQLLLDRGADVDTKDCWGSTPLADAIHYNNHDVIKLLERHGAKAKPVMATMHVKNARDVPEYEIDPEELDFTNSVDITKGTFRIASWRGTQVAVKKLGDEVFNDEEKVRGFSDELELLQMIRHPNVVQFLGAVTQRGPMMIVTEYLPKGDLRAFLKQKGPLKPTAAVRFAMDIARGMNYLHEHKPDLIIHRDLEPSNILRDDTGHLKVADFGVSELLKVTKRIKEDGPLDYEGTSCQYVAPEVLRNEDYDTKVDVFSFALILQEMIEGCTPFPAKSKNEILKAHANKERPPFKAPSKYYSHGLKELIEKCWSENPAQRPSFKQIIPLLESIYNNLSQKRRWKGPLKCFRDLEGLWKNNRSSGSSGSSHSPLSL